MRKRSTCVNCGKKRFHEHLSSFAFSHWVTPVTKSTTYHFACITKKNEKELSCYEIIRFNDFNCVIMPYIKL